jgi:hypothetical protein
LPPPYTDLKANDERLFEALGEIARACQSNNPPLPILTSIVVRRTADGSLGTPGAGYFALVFPRVRDEARRLEMWRDEVKRVTGFPYPEERTPLENSKPTARRSVPTWLREPTVIAALIGLIGTALTVVVSVWISMYRERLPQQREPDRAILTVTPKTDMPSSPRKSEPSEEKTASPKLTLEEILEALDRHHQRATYGAVAEILGRDPRSLFSGYVRSPRTAWVVNKSTGLPTGTKEDDYPPALLQNKHVINASSELREWLRVHH